MEKGDVVRCLLCAELLSYDRAESETLIAHLQDRHPYIHVAQSADILINSESNLAELAKHDQLENEYKKEKHHLKNLRINFEARNGKFGPGKVFCPTCKKLDVPKIRRQKRFSNTEGIPACYMLGCWPLCFLPYFMQNNQTFDIFCRNCSFFIGRYDRKSNILMSRPLAISKPATNHGHKIMADVENDMNNRN